MKGNGRRNSSIRFIPFGTPDQRLSSWRFVFLGGIVVLESNSPLDIFSSCTIVDSLSEIIVSCCAGVALISVSCRSNRVSGTRRRIAIRSRPVTIADRPLNQRQPTARFVSDIFQHQNLLATHSEP
jgi:hypothetical protein